ncbi:MAG: hypothetical protein HY591_02410 [Candidatus Omnitrophica bacterium]|nr:hypothetical protein [Candidatus Omnitrophota bacterium]
MKRIICSLTAVILMAGAWLIYNSHAQKYRLQVVLAKELRKAMGAMMGDLGSARAVTVRGVPADGQWYHEIAFQDGKDGPVQYRIGPGDNHLNRVGRGGAHVIAGHMRALDVRRQSDNASIVEVRIQAYNGLSLTSNFKIRLQE